MDLSIASVADITQGELAYLCKVSRATVNNWFNKGTIPCSYTLPRLNKVLKAAEAAMKAGKLPVLDEVPRIKTTKKLTVRPAVLKIVLDEAQSLD